MRVLVCGGRGFDDYELLSNTLDHLFEDKGITVIIQGEAKGADSLGKEWAENQQIPILSFPANWNKYGNSAGPIRNKQMLTEGRPDIVVAFPGGKGTANMVKQAKVAGVKVIEIKKVT